MKPSSISRQDVSRWAFRLPALATLAILICTLFPFQFLLQETSSRRTAPFLLWLDAYPDGIWDFVENIILFLPLGFAWACKQQWKQPWTWATTLVAGAGLSFLVELLQVFLPTRDPSWWDVLANTIGMLIGYSIFEHIGSWVLASASRLELKAEALFTLWRIVVAFAAYAALTLTASAVLQRSMNLSNWQPSFAQLFGPRMDNEHHPQGRILRLEMIDRILPPESAGKFVSAEEIGAPTNALAPSRGWNNLTFRGPLAPRQPASPEISRGPCDDAANALCLSGQEWQRAPIPIAALVIGIQKTNQFAVRVLYAPADVRTHGAGRIFSISDGQRPRNLDLTHQGSDLVFSFRTRDLGASRYWSLRLSDVFRNSEPKSVVLMYDGGEVVGYVDGERNANSLRLNPGAILVYRLKGVNPYNVKGYGIIYEAIMFVPLGFLCGFGIRKVTSRKPSTWIVLCTAALAPPLLLEGVLSRVSGHLFQLDSAVLGCCVVVGAFLLSYRSTSSRETMGL